MDWAAVVNHLEAEGQTLRERAEAAFPNDQQAQREMRTRASIFIGLAAALRAGLVKSE